QTTLECGVGGSPCPSCRVLAHTIGVPHLRAGAAHADGRQAVHRRIHHGLLYIVSRLCGGIVEIVRGKNFFPLVGHIKVLLSGLFFMRRPELVPPEKRGRGLSG
ncbi:Conjugative accessory protein mbeC, partial [Dysosmobacter welbionis]